MIIKYDTSLAQQAYDLADKWDKSRNEDPAKLDFSEKDLAPLNSNQIGEHSLERAPRK